MRIAYLGDLASMRLAIQSEPDYCNMRKKVYIWQHDPENHIVYSYWDWLWDFVSTTLMHGALKPRPSAKITNMAAHWGMWQNGPRNSYYVLGWRLPIWGTWHCLQSDPDYCNIRKKACIWQHDQEKHIVYSDWDWFGDFISTTLMHGGLKPRPYKKIIKNGNIQGNVTIRSP